MRTFCTAIFFALLGCGGGDASTIPEPAVSEVYPERVELVAHRGISHKDNTIESFTNALNLGFTSLETDLRMQNGEVVLAHDKVVDGAEYLSLSEFLNFASNSGARLWLEFKETEAIQPTLDALKNHQLDVVLMSYRQGDVNLIKEKAPSAITGLVITQEKQVKTASADWAVINYKFVRSNYDKIKHMKIAAWTFASQESYQDLKPLINAAISDVQLND